MEKYINETAKRRIRAALKVSAKKRIFDLQMKHYVIYGDNKEKVIKSRNDLIESLHDPNYVGQWVLKLPSDHWIIGDTANYGFG